LVLIPYRAESYQMNSILRSIQKGKRPFLSVFWLFHVLVGLLASKAVFAQDALTFPGPGHLQLKAWHYKPAGGSSVAKPVVIALHGCGGLYATTGARKGQLNARHHAMGQMLQEQGYHAIFPDSFGSRGIVSICSEAQRLANGIRVGLDERRADTMSALDWVRQQPWADVQRNNIAVLGWSHGAQTLLAATDANHSSVKAAGAAFKTAIAFYPGCIEASRTGYFPNSPLTLLLGAEDDWTLPEPCIRLGERLKQKGHAVKVKVYPDAVHDFDTPVPGLRTRSDIPSRSPARAGQGVQVGQNPAAREDAWQTVRETLQRAFQP
jgi:dienelactone hydrolase